MTSLRLIAADGKQYTGARVSAPVKTFPFMILKSTWDYAKKSRATLNKAPLIRPGKTTILAGLPDVQNYQEMSGTKVSDYIDLDFDKQHWLLYINITRYKNVRWTKAQYFAWFNAGGPEVVWAARQLTGALAHDRSHSNHLGMDNCKNFLLGDLDRDGLPKFMKIITGRARVRLYKDKREIKNVAGVGTCIAFHCIDASKDLWSINWWDYPELFDEPCITGRLVLFDKKDGHPFIARDDLHYPYDAFEGKLIFPKWLPKTDKGFLLLSLMEAPAPTSSIWKFG